NRTGPGSGRTAGTPLLEMRNVHFSYERHVPVFSGLSFEMYGGEVVAVLGTNGSGKTTLAKLACGLLRPASGSVRVAGRHPHRIPARELPGILGYVFQNPEHQFVRDRVRDEVAFTLERRPLEETERDRHVEETLHRLSLDGLEQRNPFSLSHGQKRRLSAATMLVAGAPLIAFDEPTFGQDWGHLMELEQMLEELSAQGVALLIITHDVELARRHADRILFVPSGEVSSVGEGA
ncbi:MAG: ABC transporter ATP-binding protein, partial [bacterium]